MQVLDARNEDKLVWLLWENYSTQALKKPSLNAFIALMTTYALDLIEYEI